MIYENTHLSDYLKDDWILKTLIQYETDYDLQFRPHNWLKEINVKRMIYADLYGDFLKNTENMKVLDVGGGYSSLTKLLLKNCDYFLLDFFAHDSKINMMELQTSLKKSFWINQDWHEAPLDNYDVIIANDIFPDVDQRLELFIEKYIPHCREMRLLLTFYNNSKWYLTKRVDDTELLTFLSWDGEITALKLNKYFSRSNISQQELEQMKTTTTSLFQNGRQICSVTLKGDLSR